MKTKEFLEFVDELSHEPSPLSDREGTSKQDDTVPSVKVEDSLHSIDIVENLLRVLLAHQKAKKFLLIKCQN